MLHSLRAILSQSAFTHSKKTWSTIKLSNKYRFNLKPNQVNLSKIFQTSRMSQSSVALTLSQRRGRWRKRYPQRILLKERSLWICPPILKIFISKTNILHSKKMLILLNSPNNIPNIKLFWVDNKDKEGSRQAFSLSQWAWSRIPLLRKRALISLFKTTPR